MIGVALMRALFGRWRPRGTDITYPRDQRLHRKSRRASERPREGENEGQTERKTEREREDILLPKRRRRSRHFLRLADCKCRVWTSYVDQEEVGWLKGDRNRELPIEYIRGPRNSEPRQKGAKNVGNCTLRMQIHSYYRSLPSFLFSVAPPSSSFAKIPGPLLLSVDSIFGFSGSPSIFKVGPLRINARDTFEGCEFTLMNNIQQS